MCVFIYIYIYIYIYTHTYIYVYIYRERERYIEREIYIHTHTFIHSFIMYTHVFPHVFSINTIHMVHQWFLKDVFRQCRLYHINRKSINTEDGCGNAKVFISSCFNVMQAMLM